MAKRQKHHLNFKKIQRQILNVPWNHGVFDEQTVSLNSDFHHKITKQVLYRGIPMAYTLGEIDRELLRERMEEGDFDED